MAAVVRGDSSQYEPASGFAGRLPPYRADPGARHLESLEVFLAELEGGARTADLGSATLGRQVLSATSASPPGPVNDPPHLDAAPRETAQPPELAGPGHPGSSSGAFSGQLQLLKNRARGTPGAAADGVHHRAAASTPGGRLRLAAVGTPERLGTAAAAPPKPRSPPSAARGLGDGSSPSSSGTRRAAHSHSPPSSVATRRTGGAGTPAAAAAAAAALVPELGRAQAFPKGSGLKGAAPAAASAVGEEDVPATPGGSAAAVAAAPPVSAVLAQAFRQAQLGSPATTPRPAGHSGPAASAAGMATEGRWRVATPAAGPASSSAAAGLGSPQQLPVGRRGPQGRGAGGGRSASPPPPDSALLPAFDNLAFPLLAAAASGGGLLKAPLPAEAGGRTPARPAPLSSAVGGQRAPRSASVGVGAARSPPLPPWNASKHYGGAAAAGGVGGAARGRRGASPPPGSPSGTAAAAAATPLRGRGGARARLSPEGSHSISGVAAAAVEAAEAAVSAAAAGSPEQRRLLTLLPGARGSDGTQQQHAAAGSSSSSSGSSRTTAEELLGAVVGLS